MTMNEPNPLQKPSPSTQPVQPRQNEAPQQDTQTQHTQPQISAVQPQVQTPTPAYRPVSQPVTPQPYPAQPQSYAVPQPQPSSPSYLVQPQVQISAPEQAYQSTMQPQPYAVPQPQLSLQPQPAPQSQSYDSAQYQPQQPAYVAQPQPQSYPVQPNQYPAQPQRHMPQTAQYQPYSAAQPQPAYPVQPQPQLQPPYRTQYQPPQPQQPPVIAIDPRQAWRTWRRRVVNRAMGLTFIYEAMMYVGSIIAMIALGVITPSMVEGDSTKGDGIISLASLVFAMGFLLIMRHRDIVTREFWLGGPHRDSYGEPNQIGRPSQYGGGRMQPQWFLIFVLLGMGTQSAVSLVQLVLSSFGAAISSPTSESLDQSANTVTMWLYIGLFGPICEEVMFRGVLMKELKPLGRNFAIVTSALAFGLFHGDFVQGTFAFLFGLILGFVAMEYSLIWSIALHIFNNAVLSGLIDTWFAGQLNDSQYGVYVIVLTAVGAIGAVVALVAYGRGLKQYRLQNRSIPDTYAGWTSPVFIVFIVANVAQAALSLAGVM
ncbi:CAAX protease self-immunity [Bifidobacterium reuteri DSM 23975]|uniref:CAAX protease self-immunity n=2 Tax=Bifidobacterium TaxID=1678 RepID=A0A087CM81_9BIFI|nr:CAAX protease self-immunity [Bifidobacterium reuteri DSM 23975]